MVVQGVLWWWRAATPSRRRTAWPRMPPVHHQPQQEARETRGVARWLPTLTLARGPSRAERRLSCFTVYMVTAKVVTVLAVTAGQLQKGATERQEHHASEEAWHMPRHRGQARRCSVVARGP